MTCSCRGEGFFDGEGNGVACPKCGAVGDPNRPHDEATCPMCQAQCQECRAEISFGEPHKAGCSKIIKQ